MDVDDKSNHSEIIYNHFLATKLVHFYFELIIVEKDRQPKMDWESMLDHSETISNR